MELPRSGLGGRCGLVAAGWLLLSLVFSCRLLAAEPLVDDPRVRHAATNTPGILLSPAERIRAVETFQRLVRIPGVTGEEQQIREEVKSLMLAVGAREIAIPDKEPNAPLNLALEIPASETMADQPGFLLNAHLDTVVWSTPEHIAFDAASGDFYHAHQFQQGGTSSLGGDDRTGVAAIVEAVRYLVENHWSKGAPHRRIVLLFTAFEERGCVGAKYLARHHASLFDRLELSLTIDGPLDFDPNPPQPRLIVVVSNEDAQRQPYQRALKLIRDYGQRAQLSVEQTEYGLGRGDFAHFPPQARAGLHLRSPVRGYHNRERVNVRDLVNHIEAVCVLMLEWNQTSTPHPKRRDEP
jgi:hypothetical protein